MNFDPVNKPKHYNSSPAVCDCGRPIECIDVTRHMTFNIGNVVKYIWRAGLKGSLIEDLKKARWYLDDEIKKHEGEKPLAMTMRDLVQKLDKRLDVDAYGPSDGKGKIG